jgi:hypothetical protein
MSTNEASAQSPNQSLPTSAASALPDGKPTFERTKAAFDEWNAGFEAWLTSFADAQEMHRPEADEPHT